MTNDHHPLPSRPDSMRTPLTDHPAVVPELRSAVGVVAIARTTDDAGKYRSDGLPGSTGRIRVGTLLACGAFPGVAARIARVSLRERTPALTYI